MQKGCAQLQTDRSGFPTLVCCLFFFFILLLKWQSKGLNVLVFATHTLWPAMSKCTLTSYTPNAAFGNALVMPENLPSYSFKCWPLAFFMFFFCLFFFCCQQQFVFQPHVRKKMKVFLLILSRMRVQLQISLLLRAFSALGVSMTLTWKLLGVAMRL